MPRRCVTDHRLPALLAAQDWVIHGGQAERLGLTARAIYGKVDGNQWQRLLPRVYLAEPGEPSRRQLLIAAQLWAGRDSAIDADDACFFYGLGTAHPDAEVVRIVVPQTSTARDISYVRVRRTSAPIRVVATDRLRYVEPASAVIAAARLRKSQRAVLALISDAVQRNLVESDDLVRAHVQGSPRNARMTDLAIAHVRAGVRSAPEGEFRRLAEASLILPPLLYNCLLRLPSGQLISPDALAVEAGLVNETNGRMAHERHDLFNDMQVRHDLMTEADLIVLHNSPGRIWQHGREVIAQFERIYLSKAGRGLPPGVEIVRIAA